LVFEANMGQSDPAVKFLARGAGYNVFLMTNEAVFVFVKRGSPGSFDRTTDLRLKAGLNAEAGITFFRKIEFITSCNYEYYDESIVMNTKSCLLWNARISRPIGKHGIRLFAVANDILDQQRNFERNYFDHYIEKRIYESRRSYFMAGIRWDIRSQNHH
jgi:hypothetical protein